jgi:uncharacterized peroxidase-related enzyme
MSAHRFTLAPVEWAAWLPTVDAATATPEQLAALDKSPPQARSSPYFLTLAHDVEALDQRSPMFNAVMYAPRGLKRSDRELSTVVTSIINGCVYCASVHARRFADLTKHPEIIQALFDNGLDTPLEPRLRAIVDFSAKLTRAPSDMTPADLAPLREAGLTELDIYDLIHAVAMFANANRLMLSLGEPVL